MVFSNQPKTSGLFKNSKLWNYLLRAIAVDVSDEFVYVFTLYSVENISPIPPRRTELIQCAECLRVPPSYLYTGVLYMYRARVSIIDSCVVA